MPVIRSVFFDLYGTLFTYGNMGHAFQAWHQTLANALLSFGKKISVHEIKEHCKKFFTLPIAPNEEFTAYEIRLKKFFSDYQLEVSSTWLHSFANSSMDSWQAEITLHSEAIPLLSALQKRNIHTGIISNFEHAPHVRNLLKSFGLEPYLQTIILSAEVQLKKPDSRIFLLASSLSSISPQETLFVGDNPKEDFEGAKNAGMQTYLYKNASPLMPILEIINKHDS